MTDFNDFNDMIPVPSPEEDDAPQPDPSSGSTPPPDTERTRRKRPHIASAHDCRVALSSLPRLLLMGLITPTQANTMTRIYQTLLKDYERGQSASQASLPTGLDLGALLRENPGLAELLEPILSREQIQQILQEGTDDG